LITLPSNSKTPLRPAKVITADKPARIEGLHHLKRIKIEVARKPNSLRQDDVVVDPALLHLVRLRIAQISQCPIQNEKYWQYLKASGESEERLHQLKDWRESTCFSDKEKAALTLAEALSLGFTKPIVTESLKGTRRYFKKEEITSLLLAIMDCKEE